MGSLNNQLQNSSVRKLGSGLLLRAYSAGLFPMADSREADDVFWVEPRRRGVLPLDAFHLSRSLAKVLKQERFFHTVDNAFEAVISECAAETTLRPDSWINDSIREAYCGLFTEGHAHSIETWDHDGRLVGGLYGVRIGAAFFGESMFSRATNASKAAMAHLVARLRLGGFRLLDTQFLTAHLASLGGREVTRSQYLELLKHAIAADADWYYLERLQAIEAGRAYSGESAGALAEGVAGVSADDFAASALRAGLRPDAGGFGPSGKLIVQLLSQTS